MLLSDHLLIEYSTCPGGNAAQGGWLRGEQGLVGEPALNPSPHSPRYGGTGVLWTVVWIYSLIPHSHKYWAGVLRYRVSTPIYKK